MPVMRPLKEKPGGARDVQRWDMQVQRNIPIDPGRDVPSYSMVMEISFTTDAGLRDFEDKVRALLPEVAP